MQRYMISTNQMTENECVLQGNDAHHIARVMRYTCGETIICCNGTDRTVLAKLVHVQPTHCRAVVEQEWTNRNELPVRLSIAQALPKGDKFEYVLQKGTELGAVRFLPFTADHSIVHYRGQKEERKRNRWQKIVKEAAEQAHRDILPVVDHVSSLQDILTEPVAQRVVAVEPSTCNVNREGNLYRMLQRVRTNDEVLIFIGPEGGWSEAELRTFDDHGVQPISLGKRVLRTETAAQYVLAAVSFYMEEMEVEK